MLAQPMMARQPWALKPAASMTRVWGLTRANRRTNISPRLDLPTVQRQLEPSGCPLLSKLAMSARNCSE